MEPFRFEEQLTISEEIYVRLHGFGRKLNWIKLSAWVVAVTVLLAFRTTRWFGVMLLILFIGVEALTRSQPRMTRRQYLKDRPYLHGPITCGASDEQVWVKGNDFEVRFPWSHVSGWRQGAGWIWIAGKEGGIAYFKVESLQKVGLYGAVVSAARAHVTEGDPIE